jgi:hypothetical protein
MSPNLLSRKLQKELFFGGSAGSLVIFLYSKEKFRLPEIPIFIASVKSDDSPLIPEPRISSETHALDPKSSKVVLPDELELDIDDHPSDSERLLKLLLVSSEEVYLRARDYVWCDDHGHLTHITAAELVEGMKLLLRSEHQLEKPEAYLDGSEVWRTPLRNMINLGISSDLAARNIEYRAGVTVNARMVRSWIDGSVLGPDELDVFAQMVEELKLRGHLDKSVAKSDVDFWWGELEKARLSQTGKGVKNRLQILTEAERVLAEGGDASSSNGSLFEFFEILVIDRAWVDSGHLDSVGISSYRNMRALS